MERRIGQKIWRCKNWRRAKFLTGVSALRTDPDHTAASVFTSPDIYQLSLHTDYGFYSSSIISSIDTSDLGFDLTLADVKRKLFSKNTGAAFDIGVQIKVNERLTLDASVLDLGAKINWDTKANYFLSQGDYGYEGQVFPGTDIVNGADSLDFNTKLDTLNDIFHFEKSASRLALHCHCPAILANFKLSDRWTLGLVGYFTRKEDARNAVSIGGSARWKPLRWLSLGAMYSVNQRSATNIGLHTAAKIGPLQLYFASDNLFNAFKFKSLAAVNLRAGVSLML